LVDARYPAHAAPGSRDNPSSGLGTLPSGGAAHPNAGGDTPAALTRRFWAAIVVTGNAAGLFGLAMMAVLTTVVHIGFGDHTGSAGPTSCPGAQSE
jgi:hypothetical protein